MNFRPTSFALFLIALNGMASCANAQITHKPECVPAHRMKAEQLYGRWTVMFAHPPAGLPAQAHMLLKRHAEFSESLAGTVSRTLDSAAGMPAIAGHSAQAALAGDLDEGILLLDESSDNVSITGTWNGEMKADSCGTVYQGHWKDTSRSAAADAPDIPFTLTKLP